jgi:hypothetical protein
VDTAPTDVDDGPAATGPDPSAAAEPDPDGADPGLPGEVDVDETDLVAKLTALHEAGVLTDEEYHQKVELVAGLGRGGRLPVSSAG